MSMGGDLFASMVWGSIGVGYFIYGKRQASFVPLISGVLMVVASYLAPSAMVMSLVCLGLMVITYVLVRHGYG